MQIDSEGAQACRVGNPSPWGAIEHATCISHGLWRINTESHGGYWVSAARMAELPAEVKTGFSGYRNYWEEDCDWAPLAIMWPDDFCQGLAPNTTQEMIVAYARQLMERHPVALAAADKHVAARRQAIHHGFGAAAARGGASLFR